MGNPVNFVVVVVGVVVVVVVGEDEVPGLLGGRQRLWREIAETGIVLIGPGLAELGTAT